jgi:hypothetical protein
MIIVDRSGSMDEDPSGGNTKPSKLDIAKMALNTLLAKYGDQIPFGYTTFQNSSASCLDGVELKVEPKHGSKAMVASFVAATVSGGGTNTGPAIDKVAADPLMHDPNRPGSYIMLITDGEPNCPASGTDPQYTVSSIANAAMGGIQTFVIGFGALPAADQMTMNMMAQAGGVPCTGAACNGHMFYPAESQAALNTFIESITQQIVGEFGGSCDDSCYANGCPNAGEICVQGKCVADPCASLPMCAPGDYCLTDGTSPGVCAHACGEPCAQGTTCQVGKCQPDPCATASCPDGTVCQEGACVPDKCKTTPCLPGLICVGGECVDDPCRYVKCPDADNYQCISGTGACVSRGLMTLPTGKSRARHSGCHFSPTEHADHAALLLVLSVLGGALGLRRLRRTR